MNIKELKASYKDTLKSMDTEETIDLCFYRPIGYMWAVLCAKLGIKPNAITIASIFIGVADFRNAGCIQPVLEQHPWSSTGTPASRASMPR